MAGYFGGKKISKVYLGTTVIYKEKANEPLFYIDSNLITRGKIYIFLTRKNGSSGQPKAGDPFYEGDTLRAVLVDPAFKFDGAPTYRPKGSSTRIPFETKIGDQEYWSKFPKGYDGGAYFPTTKV